MDKIGVGVVGFGKWAENHAKFYLEEGADLVAISAPSEESRKRAAEIFGTCTYDDYRKLLERHDIDAVSVVVPNHLHAEISIEALKKGKHVLVEKPMALKSSDCKKMLSASKKSGCKLTVGHELRFSPVMEKIKTLIDEGDFGEVKGCFMKIWRPPWRAGSNEWRLKMDTSGGLVFEEPIHYVDLLRWYLGTPHKVYAMANSATGLFNFEDSLLVSLAFRNGSMGQLSFSMTGFGYHLSLEVTGTEGSLRSFTEGGHFLWSPTAKESRTFYKPRGGDIQEIEVMGEIGELFDLKKEIRSWIRCIKNDKPPLFTGEMGMRVVANCEAINRSIKSGTPYKLS